jgi:hypothetical protein
VRGINTTGAAYGETWVDGDELYYNPSVAGGLTNTPPVAPVARAQLGHVVNAASGSNGSIFVRVIIGTAFGATDGNVKLSALANNDFIVYNSTSTCWENYSAAEAKTAMGLDTISGGTF